MAKHDNEGAESPEQAGAPDQAAAADQPSRGSGGKKKAGKAAKGGGTGEIDSSKAIAACQGILASVRTSTEELNEAIKGRFSFGARQRILAAGMAAGSRTVELPWEAQRQSMLRGGGVAVSAAAPAGGDGVRREEIETLIDHKVGLAVDKALAEFSGQSGVLRDAIDTAVGTMAASLETKLMGIMRENLTEALATLEQSLDDRMRDVASGAAADMAERDRIDKALEEQRKQAEKGLRSAGGDELLDQIEDVRNVDLDVASFDVGDIEEVGTAESDIVDDLPEESMADGDDDDEGEEIAADEASPSAEYAMVQSSEPVVGAEDEPAEEAEEAEEDPEAAIERYLELAGKLRGRQNPQAAIELYEKVLEIDADHFEGHVGMGAARLLAEDHDGALESFDAAIEIDVTSPAGYLGKAEVLFTQKDYTAAIEQYDTCLQLDDAMAQAYCNRGLSYYYLKNYKKSFLDLQKAYKLDPEIPNIKKYLQMVMKVLKKK